MVDEPRHGGEARHTVRAREDPRVHAFRQLLSGLQIANTARGGSHVAHDVGNSFKSREATWSYKGIKMDLKLLAEAWALVVAADPVAELSAAVLHAGLRAEAEIPLSPNPQSINSTPKPCNTEPTPNCKIPIRVWAL